MKKHDFILWLRNRLSDLPPEELDRVCGFYANAIDERMEDGIGEEAAVHAMGEPEALLREIRASLPEQYRTEPGFRVNPREGVYARRPAEQTYRPAAPKRGAGKAIALTVAAIAAVIITGFSLFTIWSGNPFSSLFRRVFSHNTVTYNIDTPVPYEAADEAAFLLPDLNGIDRVVIRADAGTLNLYPSDSDSVIAFSSDPTKLIRTQETDADGAVTLTVTGTFDKLHLDDVPWIDVSLPYGDYELVIESDAGNVCLNGLIAKKIDATVHAGILELQSVTAKESLSAVVNTGSISAFDIAVPAQGSISLSCDIGNIDLSLPGSSSAYTVNASVKLGNLDIPPVTGSGDIAVELSVNVGDLNLWFDEE